MARKKRRKTSWFKRLLLFIFLPIFIWVAAFFLWLYWEDMMKLIGRKQQAKPPARAVVEPRREPERKVAPQPNNSREQIREEDRRQLEDILKRSN